MARWKEYEDIDRWYDRHGAPQDRTLRHIMHGGAEYLRKEYPSFADELVEKINSLDIELTKEKESFQPQLESKRAELQAVHDRTPDRPEPETPPHLMDAEQKKKYVADSQPTPEAVRIAGEIEQLKKQEKELKSSEISDIARLSDETVRRARLEKLRKKSPYWAAIMEAAIQGLEEGDFQKVSGGKGNSKRYPSMLGIKHPDEVLEFMADTASPDELNLMLQDYDGMREVGYGHIKAVDNFEQQLGKIDYDEAVMLLDKMHDEGRVTDSNYRSMQARIRVFYGV